MKHEKLFLVSAILTLLFAPAILALAADNNTPIVIQPTWVEGSVWKFEGWLNGKPLKHLQRFEGVETVDGEELLVLYTGASRYYLTSDLNPRFVKNLKGEIINSMAPASAYFQWPLRVGQRWIQKIAHTTGGNTYEYEQTFRVLAYEKVKTPAGEFMAFKLNRIAGLDSPYKVDEDYWYAPSVRNIIKKSMTSPKGFTEFALTEYELK